MKIITTYSIGIAIRTQCDSIQGQVLLNGMQLNLTLSSSCVCNAGLLFFCSILFFCEEVYMVCQIFIWSHYCDISTLSFLKWPVFPFQVKCTHCIIQKNSTESPELWTQFCRHPNLKDMETTTWFYGACSACWGDYFGGRGHCVEMMSVRKTKNHWAELIPLCAFRVSGRNGFSAFRSLWHRSRAPTYICLLHLLKWKTCK